MIKIEKVFFCENAEHWQYWKLNITGLITTNTIVFNIFPYKFIAFLGIFMKTESEKENISVNICIKNINNFIINEFSIPVEIPQESEITNTRSFSLLCPLNFDINGPWFILIQIASKDIIIYWEEYNLDIGESPNSNVTEHMPLSGTFGTLANNIDINFIIKLLSSATHSLRIIDSYIDSIEFVNLLKNVHRWVRVQIITSKSSKEVNNELVNYFEDIEIKKSSNIHDRYIKINDSEYYHFGHSIKDIAQWKTCSYTKKTNQTEIDVLEKTFNTIWNKWT